jgi:hypothetical protein
MNPENTLTSSDGHGDPHWISIVKRQVSDLRYGVVQLIVHDGRVTQIERTEKTRLEPEHGARTGR